MTRLADLTLEVRDGLVLAGIHGDIDLSNVREISGTLVGATPNTATGLVVDLSNVTYLDSAGLNCLFDLNERLRTRRQRFCIVVRDESLVSRIIAFSNISQVANVAQGVDEALAAIAGGTNSDQSAD